MMNLKMVFICASVCIYFDILLWILSGRALGDYSKKGMIGASITVVC